MTLIAVAIILFTIFFFVVVIKKTSRPELVRVQERSMPNQGIGDRRTF